jgi:hypothetical protein
VRILCHSYSIDHFDQISIRQNFRLNGEDHYTIFDVPISVTNKIEFVGNNPACDSVDNPLLTPEEIDSATANSVGVLFAPGDATVVQQSTGDGKDGLGNGAGSMTFERRYVAVGLLTLIVYHIFIS